VKRVAFHTLGCKVNQYDTEAIMELFEKKGYEIVKSSEVADVYIINTCTVTSLSDSKSRQFIRRCKKINKDAKIVVVGCYAQTAPEEVMEIEGVNLVIGTKDRNKIVELVEELGVNDKVNYVTDIMSVNEFEELPIEKTAGKTRAFLKIQEGCNQFCSYCIIPYARGPIRSRKPDNIVSEVERLAANGFKEIVLTGIHIASYGKDINENLLDVIKRIHSIKGIERIRLSSIEPKMLTEEFVREIAKLNKFCHHMHLSLQSGSNKTLKRMNRKYTTEEFREIVKIVRAFIPDIALTTDIIVGFPGETEEEFMETYNFVKEISFSQIHVFKYSPRKGTPAAKFENQVPSDIKNIRSNMMIKLGEEMMQKYRSKFLGKRLKVLFENNYTDEQYIEGLTDNYIRVVVKTKEDLIGEIKEVLLKELKKDVVVGELVEDLEGK